jgi:N-acetylglucosaminyldiphosphoundecaprenol N-acetyl-beta-D-mannosaminyltransferase
MIHIKRLGISSWNTNQVKLDDVNVVNILGVGIDNVSRSQAVVKVMNMIKEGGVHHIVPMNPYKIMKIKSSSDLGVLINKTDMHIASGGGLLWASQKLKRPLKEQISLHSYMMDLVRISEINEYSIFIVVGKPEIGERPSSI